MILREKPGAFQLLFAVQGSVLPRILPRILALAGLAALMVWADGAVIALPHLDPGPMAVFGVALSLFLGFRNNAAYDRWWEARRLWGQLVAGLRALGRETAIFIPSEDSGRRLLRLALAFLHLHRLNLRGLSLDSAAAAWTSGLPQPAPGSACAALDRMEAEIAASGADGFGRKALGKRLADLSLAQAGCERIAATPLPYVYSLLVFRTAYLYCLLIPFALFDAAGWLTPLFTAIAAYVFFGLAEVSEELAHPFGATGNGLPLDAMRRTVEISLAPHLDLDPPPLRPANYVLN
ncbi:bestrophin family protein [Cribrihabitans neustonicus]|uniref:bestrophin family protein n=1 Tax=Cribrihabitans neustonicus TaxID=1429085 RepID=UPI003B5CAFB0